MCSINGRGLAGLHNFSNTFTTQKKYSLTLLRLGDLRWTFVGPCDYNGGMNKRDKSMWKMTPEQLESWMRTRSNRINSKKRYRRSDKSWKKEL